MKAFQKFDTGHSDLIHDISYDFYGKRLATCSSDQEIRVWDLNEKGEWVPSCAPWKAHIGSIWKLSWAHPEYGQIIASCSFDKSVIIWEEQETPTGKQWAKTAHLADHRDSVQDVKFAPRHLGLKIATCCLDGFVRIYEAIDVMNLGHWPLIVEFEAQKSGASCISWNPSPFDRATLAVGSAEGVKIFEYNDTFRNWVHVETLVGGPIHDVSWAPNMGRNYHLVATASKDKKVKIWKLQTNGEKQKLEATEIACFEDHQSEVWRVEWNITGTILASSGDDGTVRLWKQILSPEGKNEWQCLSIIRAEDDE